MHRASAGPSASPSCPTADSLPSLLPAPAQHSLRGKAPRTPTACSSVRPHAAAHSWGVVRCGAAEGAAQLSPQTFPSLAPHCALSHTLLSTCCAAAAPLAANASHPAAGCSSCRRGCVRCCPPRPPAPDQHPLTPRSGAAALPLPRQPPCCCCCATQRSTPNVRSRLGGPAHWQPAGGARAQCGGTGGKGDEGARCESGCGSGAKAFVI